MVEDVTERIGNASAYISKLKEILGNIVQDAIRMADSSANTSAISSEQATGILSVNRELNQLNTATNSTISAAQQSSSAVVTLSQHISNLRERLAQIVNSAFVEDGRGPSPSMARSFDPVINLSDSQVFRGSESDQVDFSGFKRAGPTSSDYLQGEDKIGDFRFLPPNSADSDWRGPSEDGARGYRPPRDSDQYGLTPFDSGTGEVRTAEGDRLVKPSQNITLDDAEFGRY